MSRSFDMSAEYGGTVTQVHGAFGDRATAWSPQLWASTHRGTTLGAVLAAGAALAFAMLKVRADGERTVTYASNGDDDADVVHRPAVGLTAREREDLRVLIERPAGA